ncbi:hypothetical protein CANARDRAFT_26534 [[Candida] arabinofermentans NRRL YB-2248]|uniref:Ribosomal protein L9 domain-containing protein n=1 Tax=[Candida] arabinofermentans NRRL YB-2248 TaxID=983967 RepID=A0A1E4T5V3_9ASCO|nr:hypothetical protein CANARDRAFT_26534 [[Candida] arabinofermentans NRRL YB-2248]
MFSRSINIHLQSIPTKNQLRFSAISKKNRIPVQLLKDFQGIGLKGEIVQVKPSLMINKLHRYNGAVYLNYKGSKPLIPVVKIDEDKLKEKLTKVKSEEKPEITTKRAIGNDLLSMTDLLSLNVDTNVESNQSIYLSKIPKKIIFSRDEFKGNLRGSIMTRQIASSLTKIISRDLQNNDDYLKNDLLESLDNFIKLLKIQIIDSEGLVIERINKLGDYKVDLLNGDKELYSFNLSVISRNEKK